MATEAQINAIANVIIGVYGTANAGLEAKNSEVIAKEEEIKTWVENLV